ncbi:hypothetical protein BK133_21290 [Paenibacillus sp. FSL H8-0548]|uniref:hypothetical protein n=1 Tax=Paenibacillus sp. FSL H8-0548 TaxID=1920422 RepID=UPI00096C8819|nr:hypothetical protein [Paenibacillus sp. FSL H8-0548]OMF25628.1 hypothetical protein BK133_21290 [Paenibacillus sp. FSL H8-0548]
MITGKKFIKSLNGHIGHIEEGSSFKVGVLLTPEDASRLEHLGFTSNLTNGEQLIPQTFGRYTRINHEGEENNLKHLPKVDAYTTLYYTRSQFAGRDERREVTEFYNRRYKKWQTEHIPAPSLNISVISKDEQFLLVVNQEFIKGNGENTEALFATNLILELFRRAEFFTEDMTTYQVPSHPIRIVDWVFLPQGEDMPWNRRLEMYRPLIEKARETKKVVFLDRFGTILQYKPDAEARGTRGFQGYVVFSFEKLGIHVFESMHIGNATYVVSGDWESVSHMSKSQIIQNSLHEYRLIHHDTWKEKIKNLLIKNIELVS